MSPSFDIRVEYRGLVTKVPTFGYAALTPTSGSTFATRSSAWRTTSNLAFRWSKIGLKRDGLRLILFVSGDQFHGSTIVTPRFPKSLTLRVTRARPCSRAVAAMRPSSTLSGCPFSFDCAAINPQRSAIASLMEEFGPETRAATSYRAILEVPVGVCPPRGSQSLLKFLREKLRSDTVGRHRLRQAMR